MFKPGQPVSPPPVAVNAAPKEGRILLAGALVAALLVHEVFHRLAGSSTAVRARQAVSAPIHLSARDTIIALAVAKDIFHELGTWALRPPSPGG